ncbi:MAG: MFS transporter [Bacteroidales bacterium]|nr:MFS transporter [Bacteroidales bacterium]
MKFDLTRFLIKNLELKEKEVKVFLLLFFHSFFIGWFIAFYFASANSEFIVQFGSEQLPYAYIVAGIAGYLMSSFYTYIQKKINTKTLFSGALIFMFFITLLGRSGLNIIDHKLLSGFVFIWAWPFISLSGIELGGLALRFLNLVQVKRLYGLFNMGGVVAAILSYFAIPLLKPIIGHLFDLLIIGALGLIVSIYLLFRLYKNHGGAEVVNKSNKEQQKTTLRGLLKEKYFIWIFAAATLSMTMIYLTDFGFLSSVKINIDPENVAQYLAIVYGGLKVGEMFISYYSRRLLTNYGVKLGLTILPITATLLIIGSSIWGTLFGVGMFFLVLMTMLKALERILRRGLDDPAFNILYQPLADEQKISVQSRVGVVMQFSIAIAGAILLAINYILVKDGVFQLKYFPLIFLPILLVWVFVAIKLYQAYKDKIRQILAEISKDKRRGTDQYQYGSEILRKHLNEDTFFAISFSATTLSEINPKIMEAYASNLVKEAKNPYFLKIVTQNIDPSWRRRLAKNIDGVLSMNLPPDVERSVLYSKNNLDYSEVKESITEEEINALVDSGKTGNLLLVIKYINKHIHKPSEELLLKMLESEDKIIKISVINISSNVKSSGVIEKIASLLEDAEYRHIAANTLLDLGSRVLPVLENLFKTSQDEDVLLKILEIYAKIGNDEAKKLLVKHLNFPNRDVQLGVIFALFYCKYQADEIQIPLIKNKIEEVIDNILWIYSAMQDIEGQHNTLKLFLALDLEKEFYFDLIFLLLSFLYEPRIITLVQKNIIGKDTIFALEIMDNFFDTEVKKLITPIFDDITPTQKLKRLNYIFPQQKMILIDRLKDIVMQDYSRLESWTVAKAIELLGKLHRKHAKQVQKNNDFVDYSDIKVWKKERVMITLDKIRRSEIPDEVFVAMYHTDELIYTTAAKIIFDENPIKCFDYLANMSPKKQDLMNLLSNNELLIDGRVKYIKRFPLFFNVPENLIPHLAKIARIKKLSKGSSLDLYENETEYIFMIMRGMLQFETADNTQKIFAKNDIIIRGLNIDSFATSVEATSDCAVIYFKRIDFFNTIISNKEIVRHILADTDQVSWVLD